MEAARGLSHLANAFGRERTQGVITAGGGERFLVLGDRVSNDEQLHGQFVLRFLFREGLDRRRHFECRRVGGVVIDCVDDQHLLVPHHLLR